MKETEEISKGRKGKAETVDIVDTVDTVDVVEGVEWVADADRERPGRLVFNRPGRGRYCAMLADRIGPQP